MAKARAIDSSKSAKRSRPALTPEARENQLISKAVKLAEKQLDDGTASSQVITHYLKLGTMKNQLELEKLRKENELLKAKADAIQSQQKTEELYREALQAMRNYAGQGSPDD